MLTSIGSYNYNLGMLSRYLADSQLAHLIIFIILMVITMIIIIIVIITLSVSCGGITVTWTAQTERGRHAKREFESTVLFNADNSRTEQDLQAPLTPAILLCTAHVTAMPLRHRNQTELLQSAGSKLIDGFTSCILSTEAATNTWN